MPEETPTDEQPVVLQEKVTLKKYDGDPPQEGEDKEPVETIVIEDGQIVEHLTKKEDPHATH